MSRVAIAFSFLTAFLFLQACSREGRTREEQIKFEQYFIKGRQLYETHCSNCHQKDGSGLGTLYPPLNESDFMKDNVNEVICLIRHGIKGEIVVNGKTYNKEMPGIPTLSDIEIAQITTYIYNAWHHRAGLFEVKTVSPTLNSCTP